MATNQTTHSEMQDQERTSTEVAAGAPVETPSVHLPNDDVVAPPDELESPLEEPILRTRPHVDSNREEDEDYFNESPSSGEDIDLSDPSIHEDGSRLLHGGEGADTLGLNSAWIYACAAILLGWAGLYVGMYSGGFQGDVFSEEVNYHPSSGPPVDPNSPEVMANVGQKVYSANCAQCHQASGLGQGGQFPPLVGSEWVIGDAPNRLAQILLHGLQGPVHVKGVAYNNNMPAWGASLNDKQIAQVLTYIRTKLGDNKAGPITAIEIGAARKQTEGRSDPWTEAELLAMPAALLTAGAPSATAAPPDASQPSAPPPR